ncbi:MAG: hypothetical protein JWO46_2913, partial [Nocardioidaceae bacterium]|nr:hypothetical protein [Nocardioidaceae bacterium]
EYDGNGGASGAVRTRHAGREVGLLLEGRLEVDVEGVTHELGPGDVIAYDSTRPHRISNPGTAPARAVWLNIDPA